MSGRSNREPLSTTYHFARPSMSNMPGLFAFTSPSVACLYKLKAVQEGVNPLPRLIRLRTVAHLYNASFSSYDVWIGPVFGKL